MHPLDLAVAHTDLAKGRLLALRHALGQRIECQRGVLWITIDGDPRDVVLEAGEGFTIDRPAPLLVSALADSSFLRLGGTAA